jgi:RimJ/RimL family protein N-acetyltransferase
VGLAASVCWPLFDLRISTPRLEMRPVREADMFELIDLADQGIHDPSVMPFVNPWTDEPLPERRWNSMRFYWQKWGAFAPEAWYLPFAIRHEGRIIGSQDLWADQFVAKRVAESGSWIGQTYQGNGFGKEMRHAIVALAFEGLGATAVTSGAFWDNGASIAVSRSLGYVENGVDTILRRGEPERLLRFRLDREVWLQHRREDIVIEGLEPCLPLFGLSG